jgi:hypothetical protein
MCNAREEFIEMATGGRRKLPEKLTEPAFVEADRAMFATQIEVGELKRRLERCRRELACYKSAVPGHLYSAKHNMLVQVDDMGVWG